MENKTSEKNLMIQLATPISHLFKNTEDAKQIIDASDCLECREWSVDYTFSEREELFHIDHNLNQPWNSEVKEFISKALTVKPHLKLTTLQMASCYSDPEIVGRMYQPRGIRLSRDEMLLHVESNIRWMRSLAPNVAFGIENNNYYPTPAYEDVTHPDFITRSVEDNGVYLLLDIAHAQVSAHNLGISYLDYISGLPLKSLIQLHICQPEVDVNGMAFDAHELPNDEMFAEVKRLCALYPVKYLTVEYYRDTKKLIGTLRRLRDEVLQ